MPTIDMMISRAIAQGCDIRMFNIFHRQVKVGFEVFTNRCCVPPFRFLRCHRFAPILHFAALRSGDARFRAIPLIVTINTAHRTRCRQKAADFIRPNQPCQTRQGKLHGTSPCIFKCERNDGISPKNVKEK
jgi:hypothetical protein